MQLLHSRAAKLLPASSMSCSSRQQQCQSLLRPPQQPSKLVHSPAPSSSSINAASTRQVCPVPTAGSLPKMRLVLCGSTNGNTANSSTKKKAAAGNRGKAAPSSSSSLPAGSGTVAAAAATATTASVSVTTATKSPSASTSTAASSAATGSISSVVSISNPPIGFSNNIVPASPLVVSAPRRSPEDYSSDEELDESCSPDRSLSASPTGTGRTAAYRCLVLDSRYLPVNVISWFRAVVMDESGKVDVLEYHPNGYAYSAYKKHPLPAVLRVRTFVDVHEFTGRLSLTRKNIMLRDHNRCQYCGSSKELTLDHVVPVCRGGLNSWTNLVTACMACNQRKGNKSLAQLGWALPQLPREPRPQEIGVIAGISKSDLEHPPLPWVPYLATFKQMLDKAQRRAAAAAAATGNNVSYSAAADLGAAAAGDAGITDAGLVTVTMHAAGPNSKAAKAAAVGGGVMASVGSKAGKAKHRRL